MAIGAVAAWTGDLADKRYVWELYRRTSPPGAGYDLRSRIWRSTLSTRTDPVAAGSSAPK